MTVVAINASDVAWSRGPDTNRTGTPLARSSPARRTAWSTELPARARACPWHPEAGRHTAHSGPPRSRTGRFAPGRCPRQRPCPRPDHWRVCRAMATARAPGRGANQIPTATRPAAAASCRNRRRSSTIIVGCGGIPLVTTFGLDPLDGGTRRRRSWDLVGSPSMRTRERGGPSGPPLRCTGLGVGQGTGRKFRARAQSATLSPTWTPTLSELRQWRPPQIRALRTSSTYSFAIAKCWLGRASLVTLRTVEIAPHASLRQARHPFAVPARRGPPRYGHAHRVTQRCRGPYGPRRHETPEGG